MRRRTRAAPVAVVVVLGTIGCVASPPPTVPRRIEGRVHSGRFVSPSTYEAFLRAEVLRASGQPALALASYETALGGEAHADPFVRARYVETLVEAGRTEQAARAIRACGAPCERSAAGLRAAAVVARARGDRVEEIAQLRRAERAPDSSLDDTMLLAAALSQSGDEEESARVLDRALEEAHRAPCGDRCAAVAKLTLARAVERADFEIALAAVTLLGARTPAELEVRSIRSALDRDRVDIARAIADAIPPRAADAIARVDIAMAEGDRARVEALVALIPPREITAHAMEVVLCLGRLEQAAAALEFRDRRVPPWAAFEARLALLRGDRSRALALSANAIGIGDSAAARGLAAEIVESAGLPMLAREARGRGSQGSSAAGEQCREWHLEALRDAAE